MHQKFQDLLHAFKVEAFKITHDKKSVEEIRKECLEFSEETLSKDFHYHFHKMPDRERTETLNMINNYVLEALMPPIIEKIVHRQVVEEKRVDAILHLLENILEVLSMNTGAPNGSE